MTTATEPASKKPKLDGAAAMDHDSPTAGKENASALPAGKPGYAEGDTHDLMPLYYKHLFPAESMMKWLAYGNDSKRPTADPGFMQRREFCFTLEGDIFARYQSFKDAKDLRTALRQKVPTKIDLGPVFNVDPTKRAAYSGATSGGTVFAPVERELVMDIDMTDYDDVRTCCSAANICGKCWPLMTVAVKVIDAGLRADFGFKHLLWVYSGRRGIHVWVCDKRARRMSNEARAAVAEYFSVYKGTDAGGLTKRVSLTVPLHPALKRAYDDVLMPYWRDTILPNQELLVDDKTRDNLLNMIPDAQTRARAWKTRFKSRTTLSRAGRSSRRRCGRRRRRRPTTRILPPRAVAEVLLRHRLRARLSPPGRRGVEAHEPLAEGAVLRAPQNRPRCVPMDPASAASFDPMAVPTVAQILNEHDRNGGKVEATAMGAAVDVFNATFWNALDKECREEMGAKAGSRRRAHRRVVIHVGRRFLYAY